MKLRLICVNAGKSDFFAEACKTYKKKIGHFLPFSLEILKSKGMARAQSGEKKKFECTAILEKISDKDFVILFDEKGKTFDSVGFSKKLVNVMSTQHTQVTLVIGGAYGADENLKERANLSVQLSDMTMNHLVATVVALEQTYRALTIWKGIPYHNE